MKVILDMVTTLNGVIARKDYTEDFFHKDNWKIFCNISNKIGCLIFGRITYELIKDYRPKDLEKVMKIVVSKHKNFKNQNKFIFVKSPKEALSIAKTLGFKQILLAGGGKMNSEFMKLNLVDEIFLNVNPVIVNNGIKVFGDLNFEHKLKLLEIKKLKNDILRMHYKVIK